MNDIPDFLQLAITVSKQSDFKIKVGCVVVKCGTPVSLGYNRFYSDRHFCYPKSTTIHAEAAAIKNCSLEQLRGAVIYVARLHKDQSLALARPCPQCMVLLQKVGIKKIVYSTHCGYEAERIVR